MNGSMKHSVLAWEHLFRFQGHATETVNYGKTPVGNRMDIHFKGDVRGQKIVGKMYGIDYALIREDNILEINVRATLVTDDGVNIGMLIEGYACHNRIYDAHVRFVTGNDAYRWLCDKIVIGKGGYTSESTLEIDYFSAH